MGQLLDKPLVEKETERCEGNGLTLGASAMQGWRREMEDAHQIQIQIPGLPGHSFIAVYDGHGGAVAAEIAGAHMLAYLQKQPQYVAYAAGGGADAVQELGQAMEAAFLEFDKDLPPKLHARGDTSGCTAVAAMITPTHIVCANSGDSRGCYCSGSEVIALSEDHKPTNPEESRRIEAAGGTVNMSRVDGSLAVSRALGDFSYKNRPDLPAEQQKVSAQPDIRTFARRDTDQILVLACDGIWDVMSNQECCAALQEMLAAGEKDMGTVCEELIDVCLEKGSKDNMSAIVVAMGGAHFGAGEGLEPRRRRREERRRLDDDEIG